MAKKYFQLFRLTMKFVNAVTKDKVQRCLDPNTELATSLQECWDRYEYMLALVMTTYCDVTDTVRNE